MNKRFIASAVGGMMLASTASAASVTFSSSFPLTDVEINGVLSVSRFDPSLGTLTGVSWTITGGIASILGVTNASRGQITGAAFTSVDFDVAAPELSLAASPDFNVFATTGPVTLGVGESALFPVTAQTTITGTEAPGAQFLLPGTIDLSFRTTTSFGGSGFGGDIIISQATDAGLSFEITYDYDVPGVTPIPLPAGFVLLAGALGVTSVFGIGRKRVS
jgi:hypothetical protein